MTQTLISRFQRALDVLEQVSDYVCFEFAGTSLGLYCDDPEVIDWLTEYFSGYFVATKKKDPDATIYNTCNAALFELFYDRLHAARRPGDDEYTNVEITLDDQHVLLFDGEVSKKGKPEKICYMLSQADRKILTAFIGPTKTRQVIALRIVRNLMNLLMYDNGWLPIHATSYIRNGTGVSIIGGKFAGKTSMLFNMLEREGTKLVATDRLFLRDEGTYLQGCGFPRPSGLRVGTLLTTPKLQYWVEQATETFYPQISAEQLHEIAATTPAAELQERPEKITLIPSELAASFDVEIQAVTPIKLIVAVSYDPDLDEAQFLPMEKEAFLSLAASLSHKLAKRQKFLRTFFSYDDQDLRERLVDLLEKYSQQLTLRELHQNERTNDQSAAFLDSCVQNT